MIRVQDLSPAVYYDQSRDFQLFGRLYDIVLNHVKTNAELINTLPVSPDVDSRLIELLATTLGFKARHTYSIKQLTAICTVLPTLLKIKGTKKAIDTLIDTLLNSEGITSSGSCEVSDTDPYNLIIKVPRALTDQNLLLDLLDYLLPAGMTFLYRESTETIYSMQGTALPFDSGIDRSENMKMSSVEKSIVKNVTEELQKFEVNHKAGLLSNSVVLIGAPSQQAEAPKSTTSRKRK